MVRYHMGSNNGKHDGEKENNKRRSHFRRLFQINHTPRPLSYAGINEYYEEQQISTRPMSMIDVGPFDNLELEENLFPSTMNSSSSSCSSPGNLDQSLSNHEESIFNK